MVAIYLDSGSLADMRKYGDRVEGFTSNPSIMKKDGISDYRSFARAALEVAAGKPISFEVLADDEGEMEMQAHQLAGFGPNVYVKIPITTSEGVPTLGLVRRLLAAKINVNVTAVMTIEQALSAQTLFHEREGIISIFCGRIMDTQRIPLAFTRRPFKNKWLWASAREIFNVRQAQQFGYDLITLSPALLDKMALKDKDLTAYSLETVKQFYQDGKAIAW